MPTDAVLRYGLQIADALAHAHRHRVIHRDLKAANVVVTAEGVAKVLDYGLSTRLPSRSLKDVSESTESITAAGLVAGTLACMPPEVLSGESPDERGDIWPLGVLCMNCRADLGFLSQTVYTRLEPSTSSCSKDCRN